MDSPSEIIFSKPVVINILTLHYTLSRYFLFTFVRGLSLGFVLKLLPVGHIDIPLSTNAVYIGHASFHEMNKTLMALLVVTFSGD